jgi:hypothetical protein
MTRPAKIALFVVLILLAILVAQLAYRGGVWAGAN